MKTIVIYTDGTLGDHLPNIALGQALQSRGYRVRMAINQAMHGYAQRAGLEAIALTDVERGPEEARQNAWAWNHWRDPNTARPANFSGLSPDDMVTQARELIEICRDADVLLATSIRILGMVVHHATQIPWLTVSLNPSSFWQSPVLDERQAQAHSRQQEYDQLKPLLSYMLTQLGVSQPLPEWRDGVIFARHILLASSPHFSQPNVEQFQPHASLDLTGFWFYRDAAWQDWQPNSALARFCQRRPIALSFSSQPLEERRQTLAKHVHAAARLNRPLLVQRGWADFSENDLPADAHRQDILFADFIPHDWLFANVACAIQHGGIGSIARALRQGCPLLIEPYGNDQFYNANRVQELGVGAALSPFRSTVNEIAHVLNDYVLTPDCRARAQTVGAQLAAEDGLATACEMIERYLNRLDEQGRLPSIYARYTPSLAPRQRSVATQSPLETVHASSSKQTLILFYNLMWGQPLDFNVLNVPPNYRWTTNRAMFNQADAVVFHIPSLDDITLVKKPAEQIWVAWSQECEAHYPLLRDAEFMRRFDLTMTYHRDADVPVPYYSVDMLPALQTPPRPKIQTAPAALFLSSPHDQSQRLTYLAELMRHLPVHSYGRQLNNVMLPQDHGRAAKLDLIAQHKFTLAFENALASDYVTEKFFDPLLVGSVPVYWGAPNIAEFAPGENCFVNARNFDSPKKLAEYLLRLSANDAAYQALLAWRAQPLRAEFVRMVEQTREHWFVRLCRKVQMLHDARQGTPIELPPVTQPTPAVSAQAIPKILHQTWKDYEIPAELDAYRQTWRAHHPAWEFRLWTDVDNREFIRQNYGWFLPIYDGYPENIMRADAARYFILYHYGGVYADLDIECVRPLDTLIEGKQILLGLEPPAHWHLPAARQAGLRQIIGNALIASVPRHPFWEHVFKMLVGFHQSPSVLGATGSYFLTQASIAYPRPADVAVASHELLYPTSHDKPWQELPSESKTQILQTAYTIHHWRGNWWRNTTVHQTQTAKLTLLAHGDVLAKTVIAVEEYRAWLAKQTPLPKISCLMVTKNRTAQAKRAIHCFQKQTYANRELVIIDDSPGDELAQWVRSLDDSHIVYTHLPDEQRALGELRNQAVRQSTGEYIAQWDDDDLSDPMRLELQMAVVQSLKTEACCLERHQILWLHTRRLAVSTRRIWEGSFLCAKSILPMYPAQRQGEDTPVVEHIVQRARVGLLDLPLLYTYVFHGTNTFDAEHWERHWLSATESFEGPLFETMLQSLQERLGVTLINDAPGE